MKRLFEGGGYSDISVNDTAGGGIYSQMVAFISRLGTYQKKYDMYKLIFYAFNFVVQGYCITTS